jgi:LacI family transcriptional regulator
MPRPRKPPGTSPVGVKDIARALGVSTGTVDRALNGKHGISAETRARVLELAAKVGYTPNLAARYLQSRRPLRIAVHLPERIAFFWEALREGIREAAGPFAPALEVEFLSYPALGEGDLPLLERALAERPDGLIIAPGNPVALAPVLRQVAEHNIPVVCVVTDTPDSPRLLSVSADPSTVGAIAGELLGRFLPAGGQIAFFTGWLATQDHAEKLRGFITTLSATSPNMLVGPIVEAHDDEREAHRRACEVLRAHPDLKGIYISTANSLPVLRAAEEVGRLDGLTVVTTDLFPELADYIRAGKVVATVYQRPLTQGRVALQALHEYLHYRRRLESNHRVVPYLVMKSNLDIVLDRLSGERKVVVDPPSRPHVAAPRSSRSRRPGRTHG